MSTGVVIFDRQHYGKPTGGDLGAAYDLDHDGTVEDHEREANLTPRYYLPAKKLLEEQGHTVYVLDQGWYSARHREARRLAILHAYQRCVYVACHVNAGASGSNRPYSLVISDERSRYGRHIAAEVSSAIRDAEIPGLDRCITREGTPTEWTNGLNTIKGIYEGPNNIAGICFEPYFLDNHRHHYASTEEGSERIGAAMAAGLHEYFQNRRRRVY